MASEDARMILAAILLAVALGTSGAAESAAEPFSSPQSSSSGIVSVPKDLEPAFTSKTMLDYLTNTTGNFEGRTFIVAVHEEHPFVFFDCDHVLAICGYSTQNGGSESCGVRQTAMDPLQCTAEDEESLVSLGEFSVQMVVAVPYASPSSVERNFSANVSVAMFDVTVEARLKEALATAVQKPSASVHINSITDPAEGAPLATGEHRRRLLAAAVASNVDFSIAATSLEDARAIAFALTVRNMNREMQKQGLHNMTSIYSDAHVIEPVSEHLCTTEFPQHLSSSTPSNQLPQWACGRESDGQGSGLFRKGKDHGGCDVQDKYYPFCGITIEIMDAVCMKLNCKLEFYISHKNPHYWGSQEKALCAIGSWHTIGTAHWADIAAGAIHIDPETSGGAIFTTPFYQTGYRLVVPRPAATKDWFAFKETFDDMMWLVGIIGECIVVGTLLFLFESPEMPWNAGRVWSGKNAGQDTDVVPGVLGGYMDCLYWSFTTYTRYVDKAPRTPGGKFTMLGHGFYMLIMISSYVANLASVLSQRDNTMDFSGWYEGNKPIIARMEDVELAIPLGTSQVEFIHHEEVAEGRKFMRVDCYETWEESMDAVLCGEAPAAFHDEAMILYYLNHNMKMFGEGEYTPRIGNCETERNPHELKYWGSGKKYVWGENEGYDSKGCSLAITGEVFHTAAYGIAFGFDNRAFIGWSQAILDLKESQVISQLIENYHIGSTGVEQLNARCAPSNNDDGKFLLTDFNGLYIILGILIILSIIVQYINVKFLHAPIDPFDDDFGEGRKHSLQKVGWERRNEYGELVDEEDEERQRIENALYDMKDLDQSQRDIDHDIAQLQSLLGLAHNDADAYSATPSESTEATEDTTSSYDTPSSSQDNLKKSSFRKQDGTFREGASFKQTKKSRAQDGVAKSIKEEYAKSLKKVHLDGSVRQRRTVQISQMTANDDIESVEVQELKGSSAAQIQSMDQVQIDSPELSHHRRSSAEKIKAMDQAKIDSLDRSHHRFSRLSSNESVSEGPLFGRLLSTDNTSAPTAKRASI